MDVLQACCLALNGVAGAWREIGIACPPKLSPGLEERGSVTSV